MLKQWIPAAKPDKEELDKRLDAAQEELLRLQMQIKEHKLPVLVLIEGWGAVIIKFWVQIDKDTQLERFTERQNTPEKQWKITDEDWRNRDKWDQYEDAVNEMLQKTSTEYAPWHILESVDKKYARIKALKIVIAELEKALG
jgi:polyphosphate kinase 2 (PPK2 family)